jgi:hypothetical protein
MTISTHKHRTEISISLSFCILFVVLLGTASTAATLAYSRIPWPEYGSSGSSSNSTGNSAGGGSGSSNAEGGLEDSGYKDSVTKGQSGESTARNDATSAGSLGSSSSNSTTDEKLGGSQDKSIGSGSNVGNSRGGTEGNDTGKSIMPAYGTAGSANDENSSQNSESASNTGSEGTGLGITREIAPGAPAGPHTLEYIQAFNTASGNPYKPGTKQYQNYQAGLRAAKKAGRDCDKMDTCGGPDLLGNYVNGALHLSDKQYCGNGFGVYSTKLCKFPKGCIATLMGTLTCPSSELPLVGKLALTYRGK